MRGAAVIRVGVCKDALSGDNRVVKASARLLLFVQLPDKRRREEIQQSAARLEIEEEVHVARRPGGASRGGAKDADTDGTMGVRYPEQLLSSSDQLIEPHGRPPAFRRDHGPGDPIARAGPFTTVRPA
jgi:hypothetical protein